MGKIKLISSCKHNRNMCAVNCHQDTICQEYTGVKPAFLPYGEPDLCNDYTLKDSVYIDHFCINFPCHCFLDQVDLNTNLLNNVVLRKGVL